MGGLAFVLSAMLAEGIFLRGADRTAIVALTVGFAYLLVGFLDDFLKKRRRENLGLRAWQKALFQTFAAIFAGLYCMRAGLTVLHVPFWNKSFDIGWWMFPLAVFVFLSAVNCVNLTDGLDGLAAGTCVPFFLSMGIIVLLWGGSSSLAMLAFCLCGALAAYLLFNASPASVFMGTPVRCLSAALRPVSAYSRATPCISPSSGRCSCFRAPPSSFRCCISRRRAESGCF